MSPYRQSAKSGAAKALDAEAGKPITQAIIDLALSCAQANGDCLHIDLDENAFDAVVESLGSAVLIGVTMTGAQFVTVIGPRGLIRVTRARLR